jgi:predicted nucleic-acid-binding protein
VNVGLDTTVVLRLITGEPSAQFTRAETFLDELSRRGDQPVVSDLVAAEVYFALQHHFGITKAEALHFLVDTFESGEIKSTGVAADILKTPNLASAKPGFVDRLIHAAYLKDTTHMATFEKASAKLPSVQVL